jgi:hypothetical protein
MSRKNKEPWIYQITPDMKLAEKKCNQRGIFMEIVIKHERYDYVHLRYKDETVDKVSPKPYVSKKEAEMVMYNHYIKICEKLKIPL